MKLYQWLLRLLHRRRDRREMEKRLEEVTRPAEKSAERMAA